MTMLNGEPVNTNVPSTKPPVGAVPGAVGEVVRPIANPMAQIMGIIGLILAFAFSPVGLIISIIAKRMSKKAGDRSPFATWGIVLGIIFTVLWLLFTIAVILVSVGGVIAGFDLCENGPGDDTFVGIPITCG